MALKHLTLVPTPEHVSKGIKSITKAEVDTYLLKVENVESLEEALKAAKSDLKVAEDDFMGRLKAGAKAPKEYLLAIEKKVGRVAPSWKHEFAKLCLRVGLNFSREEASIKQSITPSISEVLVVVRK